MPENDDQPLRPMVELSPDACGEIRRALKKAVRKLHEWGVHPSPGSWVQEADEWLREFSNRDLGSANDDELRRGSAAIRLAVDLYHISVSLGDESNRAIAVELSRLPRGSLLSMGSLEAQDYMSQFWMGTFLAQSGLNPEIIAYDIPGRAKPDFVITKAGVRFAVEVKRPRTRSGVPRAVLRAGTQLRSFPGPGIIIVDATACMSSDPLGVIRSGPPVRDVVRGELREVHSELDHLVSSYRRSGKFAQTALLMTFARYWAWNVADRPIRDAGLHFHATGFSYVWSRQITGIVSEIQSSFGRGVEQLTGNPGVLEWSPK